MRYQSDTRSDRPHATERPAIGTAMPACDVFPVRLLRSIERLLGTRIVDAVRSRNSTPGELVAHVRLGTGGFAVVEAASFLRAPLAAGKYRQELRILQRLPADLPIRRLIGGHDDNDWAVLVFDSARSGPPMRRWQRDEFERALEAVSLMADALTPSPVGDTVLGVLRPGNWLSLARDAVAREKAERVSSIVRDHFDDLAALEGKAPSTVHGRTLLHGGLCAGSVTVTSDRVVVGGWANAWIGAQHCDVVALMSAASLSGLDPQRVVASHALTESLDDVEIDVALAVHAGALLAEAARREHTEGSPGAIALHESAGAVLRWWAARQ